MRPFDQINHARVTAKPERKRENKQINKTLTLQNKMTRISTDLSITTHINGFNFLIKRHRLVNWIKKQDPFAASYASHQKSQMRP